MTFLKVINIALFFENNRKEPWKSCLYCMPKYNHFEYIPIQVYLIRNKTNIFQAFLLCNLGPLCRLFLALLGLFVVWYGATIHNYLLSYFKLIIWKIVSKQKIIPHKIFCNHKKQKCCGKKISKNNRIIWTHFPVTQSLKMFFWFSKTVLIYLFCRN
jgi:hypothetical protein